MVLPVKVKLPELERLKVSRVVLISGILTFLYLIEFCIGIRTVYYAFSLWNADSDDSPKTPKANLAISIAGLMVCIASSFVVNITSALWDQKQMKEDGKVKRVTRFALHILVGAMVWRYVSLWFSDNKKSQKKESLLLAMAKFLFTQIFTVPLVILHASLIESLEEVVYVIGSVSCISVNLILTCAVFAACQTEVKELRKWNYETLDLVPLIFCQTSAEQTTPERQGDANAEKKKESEQSVVVPELPEGTFETHLMRFMVLFQTFGFTFGRLLALGILLKLAGIYAISIMFLQLLISVVYLKFQVPFLVSDSLPKWRQLTRLAFMSYILIFEWQLNRDPATGYDFTSNIRHSILYYSIATIESIFYFIAWAIADSYSTDETFDVTIKQRQKLVKSVIIIGTMSLIFSLMVYFFLALWHSRRLSALMLSVRRRYVSTKLKMTNSILKKGENTNSNLKNPKLDISNPIPIGDENDNSKDESNLEKHSSYKDLKEPLDEEIEIYVGRSRSACEFQAISECISDESEVKSTKVEECYVNSSYYISESMSKSEDQTNIELCKNKYNEKVQIDPVNESEINDVETSSSNISDKASSDGPAKTGKESKSTKSSPTASANKKSPDPQQKSKITIFSESLGEGWNKFSALSKRFTGTMKDTFQKRREQFQQDNKNTPDSEQTDTSSSPGEVHQNVPEEDGEEGFFVGDARCRDQDSEPKTDIDDDVEVTTTEKSTSVVDLHHEDTDSVHCIGVEPCPCFVCKPDTEGRLVRRRRSSSVPPPDRKSWLQSEMLTTVPLSTPSSPVRVDLRRPPEGGKSTDDEDDGDEESETASEVPSLAFTKLSLLPPEERIEHYV